jgi:hypothetical protein
VLLAGLGGFLAGTVGPARAGQTERVMVDPVSGLAIYGYDPVCYFVDGEPRAGMARHELVWSGVTWRFRSPGNLKAFLDAPEVYAPAFGGYAAEFVADSKVVTSDPTLFAIESERLYLFRSAEGRETFGEAGHRMAAEAIWPALMATLTP